MRRPLAVALLLAGCDDALDQRLAIVDEPRVLAVISEPAEAKPGATATYTALVAGPDGALDARPRWAYCTTPKPPTEDNAVAVGCIAGTELIELGEAASVTATLPADGCSRFGPVTPPGDFRPRDADPTGGYYQPIRVDVTAETAPLAIGFTRITCELPSAPADIARRYALEYVANANPALAPITLATAPVGTDVTLVATWPAGTAEPFLYYDRLASALVDRRESLRVSWFATAGAIAEDATAVAEADPATSASTIWRTPDEPGVAHVWFVLRDSRGGIATQSAAITLTN